MEFYYPENQPQLVNEMLTRVTNNTSFVVLNLLLHKKAGKLVSTDAIDHVLLMARSYTVLSLCFSLKFTVLAAARLFMALKRPSSFMFHGLQVFRSIRRMEIQVFDCFRVLLTARVLKPRRIAVNITFNRLDV